MGRRRLLVALVAYAVLLAVALLAPTSTSQSEGASWLSDLGVAVGIPERFATQARAEFVANALIVAPVAALGSLVWPRSTWRDWTAYAFLGAGLVEIVQGLLLPARTAAFVDVVANALGALLGALVVDAARRIGRPTS